MCGHASIHGLCVQCVCDSFLLLMTPSSHMSHEFAAKRLNTLLPPPFLQRYSPTTGEWTNLSPLPMERSGFSTGVVDGMLYIVGGCSNLSKLNLVNRYDPEKDEWSSVANMSVRRSGMGVAVAPAFLL